MSNPFKKRHTKSNGCDLILSYCLLRYVVIEQQQWENIGHSMKILYLSRIRFNLLLLQDRVSLGLSLYSFHTTVFLVVGLFVCCFGRPFFCFSYVCEICVYTHIFLCLPWLSLPLLDDWTQFLSQHVDSM